MKTAWRANFIEIAPWLVAAAGSALLALIIAGCAREPTYIKGSGEAALPPIGWVIFCQENPKHHACGRAEARK